MKDVLVILDPGHGKDTKGKRSPKWSDGSQLFEWEFTRKLADLIQVQLNAVGIRCVLDVTEDNDISLSERANRINKLYYEEKEKGNTAIMISLHGNAAGNGKPSSAHGWEVYSTTKYNNSDKLAECFVEDFPNVFPDQKLRGHKQKDFTVIYKSNCPCVLTENFFYDNEEDCKLMLSDEGLNAIADLHIRAIKMYINGIN